METYVAVTGAGGTRSVCGDALPVTSTSGSIGQGLQADPVTALPFVGRAGSPLIT